MQTGKPRKAAHTEATCEARDEQGRLTRRTDNYKWFALFNTTPGMLLANLNATSLVIAMLVIFRGLQMNPLAPESFDYPLWSLMG